MKRVHRLVGKDISGSSEKMNMPETKLLVTGASGQLGRETLEALIENGVAPEKIIATTRDPSKLSDMANRGIEVRRADFSQPETLDAAFKGASRIAVISTDAIAPGTDRITQHMNAISAAVKAGVKRVVYTSMPDPAHSKISFAPDHLASEKAVYESGLTYTILRNSWYQENMLMNLPQAFASGIWATAAGDGKQTHIGHDDCARALAAALTAEDNDNHIYTLTGPESFTMEEIASIARDVIGKPLEVKQVSEDALRGGLEAAGLPGFVVALSVSTDANIRAGGFDLVTSDFETLTGRKPRSLRAFFEANKAAF